ncbi:Unknown protein [Striga hermonthica]|uniref:DUF7894 domain-containing protein n=1 Tax=Striga hermonthica TaxID=68872 RepID=A0A9N7RT43_STRHE|nr:Unknown protein [Striga hermonthica]
MKVAEKVILLLDGGDALSAAVSSGLNPSPSSNFKMLGDYEVSIVLLQSYEPPILACALNEVYREDLATLLHLLTAMKLPALVLIGQSCQRVARQCCVMATVAGEEDEANGEEGKKGF